MIRNLLGRSLLELNPDLEKVLDTVSSSSIGWYVGNSGVTQEGVNAGHDNTQFFLPEVATVLHIVQVEDPT